jgi:hypothetical protein
MRVRARGCAFGVCTVSIRGLLIGLALVAGAGIAFLLFVIEPRRKIYDYDPSDRR